MKFIVDPSIFMEIFVDFIIIKISLILQYINVAKLKHFDTVYFVYILLKSKDTFLVLSSVASKFNYSLFFLQ